MCRLFALSGGRTPLTATFWLLEAPDSLSEQSRREPDGTGVGVFDAATDVAQTYKQPLAAYEDQAFAKEARELHSRTFLAHIRFASTGAVAMENTHPFEQDNRLFAHNGVIGRIDALDRELGGEVTVKGGTDSERFFALITRQIRRGATPAQAITAAAQWIAANLPVYALNCILTTSDELFALRYPETHELHILDRTEASGHLRHRGANLRVHAPELPSVVIASEPMDDDPGWRALASGELVHVDADLNVTTSMALTTPPAHLIRLSELSRRAQSSQAAK